MRDDGDVHNAAFQILLFELGVAVPEQMSHNFTAGRREAHIVCSFDMT